MHQSKKFTWLISLALICFSAQTSFAQIKKLHLSKREAERRSMHSRDSLIRSINKTDTSVNGLIQRIEQYTTIFNQINNNLSNGLDTADAGEGIPMVMKRLGKIDSLGNTHKSSTLRYLFVLRDNLDHIQDDLDDWQSGLADIAAKLVQNQTELIKFFKDTSFKAIPEDSTMRASFFAQLKDVKHLFKRTDSVNRSNLLRVNLLQDKVAIAYTRDLDESDQIDSKIKRFAEKAIVGDADYIWATPFDFSDFKPTLQSTLKLNKFLFNFFIKNETSTHIIALIFWGLIFFWIHFVRVKTLRHNATPQVILDQANFISRSPSLTSILVGVAVTPYFYDHPPVVFLQTFFLISMIIVLIFIKRNCPPATFKFATFLFVAAIIYSLSNLFIQISTADRYLIFALSIASIFFAFSYLKKIRQQRELYFAYSGLAMRVFITLEVISSILNISGRFSLAKIIGITAVFNLWLLVILFFVVQIITQAMFLQFQTKREGNNLLSWIDYNLVQKKFQNILIVFAGLLWGFFLLQNLNLDDWAHDLLDDLLSQSRTVGGASFTFGGFVIFIAVIWLSSVCSKIISYFYDVSAQKTTDLSVAKKKNRTSTLLIRLAVFSAGFLLAVAASGFPLEKLTIIISAFGIGIGFGLQTIVNNLVSGLILAFEKPIQIGDIIEVDNRSGTMKEIGIRSSKILTSEGSEVIIPNGDLISHHVVNWTLSNSNRRIELIVATAYGTDIDAAKNMLKEVVSNRDDIMTDPGPSVFVHNVTENSVDFRVFFWADDITKTLEIKSKVLADIFRILKENKIERPSTAKDINLHFPDGEPTLQLSAKTVKETPVEVKQAKAPKQQVSKNPPEQGQ